MTKGSKSSRIKRASASPTKKEEVDKDGLTKKEREDYIRRAKAQYEEEGSIEIDENAVLSVGGDKGVYVQAWVWVYDEEEIPFG